MSIPQVDLAKFIFELQFAENDQIVLHLDLDSIFAALPLPAFLVRLRKSVHVLPLFQVVVVCRLGVGDESWSGRCCRKRGGDAALDFG